ncbi:MAG TPA: plastocyanin/azurin family copper-binding protein, partial [Mycobacterium sp.]|nr:plastocyanin/azurin family copper-binding protein [Mycobacterium sp.]
MTGIRGLLFVVPLAMLMAVVAPAANGAPVAVSIRNTGTTDWAFQPRSVTINVGDSVTWTNRSDAGSEPHTVRPDSGGFGGSAILQIGDSYSATFRRAGRFSYHCEIHPAMTGVVTVVGANPTPRPTPKPTPRPTPKPTP